MLSMSPGTLVLVLAVGLFTAVAAFSDMRTRRIPNKLTLPMFFAGWVYQIVMSCMYGWHLLGSAALGFLIGFGTLFVLWFVGGGGGGDVKLMGALSVWLGFRLTLYVLIASTLLVLTITVGVVLWTLVTRGVRGSKRKYLATGKTKKGEKPRAESREEKQNRRIMAYATPVAVATWLVLIWKAPSLDMSLQGVPAAPAAATAVDAAE